MAALLAYRIKLTDDLKRFEVSHVVEGWEWSFPRNVFVRFSPTDDNIDFDGQVDIAPSALENPETPGTSFASFDDAREYIKSLLQ